MKHLEDDLQADCVTWFRLQYPDVIIHHSKNEGNRGGLAGKIDGKRNKAMGVHPGFADLQIIKSKYPPPWDLSTSAEAYHGFFIEVKEPGKYQTPEQKDFQRKVESEGYKYQVCKSIDEFIEKVNAYMK